VEVAIIYLPAYATGRLDPVVDVELKVMLAGVSVPAEFFFTASTEEVTL
jgi:hypothetical protein